MAKIIQAFDYSNPLSIIFLRYHGKELTTNMIIVDLKMLSGFSPDPDSLGRVSCWDLYPRRSCLICVPLFKDEGSLFMQYQ